MIKTPTEKQINLVENICELLEIDYPINSKEFTRKSYSAFIAAHIDLFKEVIAEMNLDYDYLYETCINDIWTEMF